MMTQGYCIINEVKLRTKEGAVIPKAQLRHGVYYRGTCRNATIARWNNDEQRFYHWRTEWGQTFIETICHRDDDDQWDVFDAFEEVPDPVQEIPFEEPT